MDSQHFGVHGHQSQIVNNPTSSPPPIQTGGLTERTPLTLQQRGLHPYDPSFLSSLINPRRVFLDSLPPENEESYAKGWYGGFIEESHAAEAESSQVSDVEAIRNMATGQSESLGFIKSNSHAAADERPDDSAEFSVFVANLAAEVTDYILEETFKVKYTSVKGARVVTDRITGRSKGYGFVRFADKDEQMRSVTELNGQYCLTKPIRIGPIGRTSTQKGMACAEEAMMKLNGTQLGGSKIRLAWAPSPSNEQDPFAGMVQQHLDSNQRPAGNMYGYTAGYEAYGYAQDPNMFSYQGYPGYGYYHQQQ
ncbi:hypothetical protein MKW92_039350 [Papaver armeniacum]|nr:hypothetical protein MKW92_039350 [Papaver armeniacum]